MASNWQNITVQEGQSLYDIALQHYGNAEAVIDLVRDNGLQGVTQQLQGGQLLAINTDSMRYNKAVVNYYRANNCLPATQQGVTFEEVLPLNIVADYQPFTYNDYNHTYIIGTYANYLRLYFDTNNVRRVRLELTSDASIDFLITVSYDAESFKVYGRALSITMDIDQGSPNYIGMGIMYNPLPMTGTIKLAKFA